MHAYTAPVAPIEYTETTRYTIARWIVRHNDPNSKWLWISHSSVEQYNDEQSAINEARSLTEVHVSALADSEPYFAVKITDTRKVEAVTSPNKIENTYPHSPLPTVIK